MDNVVEYRLDWRREFSKLSPYLDEKGGIVLLEYDSEHAAPYKFNYIMKERFAKPKNTRWLSLRIDHEWFTTRQVSGIIDELDRLLSDAGFKADLPANLHPEVKILTDVQVAGNMNAHINNLQIGSGTPFADRTFQARLEAVMAAMRRYIQSGGRLMVIVNDAPLQDQTEFWQRIWHAGLSEAGGDNMLLVIHAGPKAARRQHHDSPAPHERIVLPVAIEQDSERDEHFYDDILDAFSRAGVNEPAGPAGVHIENNRESILQVNLKLSAAIISAKRAQGRRKA